MTNRKALPAPPWLRMFALVLLALLNGCAVVSVKEKGATGRPVPLLTAFLLQRATARKG